MSKGLQQVLLVEDEEAHAEIFSFYARRFDAELEVVHLLDGESALRYLDQTTCPGQEAPDLIVLDLNLPRYSGLEILRRIKEEPAFRKIPVVILSSSTSAGDLAAAWDLGVNSYLRKPMEQNGFEPLIRQTLGYWSLNEHSPGQTPET